MMHCNLYNPKQISYIRRPNNKSHNRYTILIRIAIQLATYFFQFAKRRTCVLLFFMNTYSGLKQLSMSLPFPTLLERVNLSTSTTFNTHSKSGELGFTDRPNLRQKVRLNWLKRQSYEYCETRSHRLGICGRF